MFTEVIVNFMKTGTVRAPLCLWFCTLCSWAFLSIMKIFAGNAILSPWAQMKFYLHMYPEDDTVKAKNAMVKCVQSGVYCLQFCYYGFNFLRGLHLKSRK